MSPLTAIWWEAQYDDGSIDSEIRGAKYGQINRPRLSVFRLRDHKAPLIELPIEDGRSGWNLVYRRRTTLGGPEGKTVSFVLGWVPQGPIIGLDTSTGKVYQSNRFVDGDALFYPPRPLLGEGERWSLSNSPIFLNPAFEKTDS